MSSKRKILENPVKNLAKNCTNVDVSDRSGAESCGSKSKRGGQRIRFFRSSVDNEDSAPRDSCSDLRRYEHSLEISPKYLRTQKPSQDDSNHSKDSILKVTN